LLVIVSIEIGDKDTLEKIEHVFAWSGYDLNRIRRMIADARATS